MLVMAPRDQSNSEAPGLPVALSKIAGVTNTPVPSFPFVKLQFLENGRDSKASYRSLD